MKEEDAGQDQEPAGEEVDEVPLAQVDVRGRGGEMLRHGSGAAVSNGRSAGG